MPKPTTKLTWCKTRLGEDMNWWVLETSDPLHWDVDGLGIVDPRQFQHIIDLIEPLQDYGLQNELVDDAFYSFGIDTVDKKDKIVTLKRVQDSILESEDPLFALPDVLDDEKGPYADLLDHLTKLRIKLLNDLIDFSQTLTVEELEEDIREKQNADYMEGRASHFFTELTAILEYVPEGFALEEEDDDENSEPKSEDEKLEKDLGEIDDSGTEEKIEEDDTMKWDEEEEEEEEYQETTAPPEEADEEKK
jgi:hypothetical protein